MTDDRVLRDPPVRPCCGQRHAGAVCPDGTFMCCLCFEKIEKTDAFTDAEGNRWDICGTCGDQEEGDD